MTFEEMTGGSKRLETSVFQFTCDKCGWCIVSPDREGKCSKCGVEWEIQWQAEYVPKKENTGFPVRGRQDK